MAPPVPKQRKTSPRVEEALRLFGERLASLRAKAGLSQEALGQAIGSDGNQIYRYEKGRSAPTLTMIVLMADVLGVEPHRLLMWPRKQG
jgi:transcriptional regulator with XRE-family HTH domain